MTSSDAVLISPAELAELLGSARPPVVADVRWVLGGPPGKPDFEASHIPGAVWVDLETQLAGPPGVGGRHPLPAVGVFEQSMREIGVCQDSPVVAYDAATSQAASRLWWLLTDAGHRDVRVLDGGLAAWTAAGLPTFSGPGRPPPRGDFVAHPGQRPQLNASDISARLGRPDAPTLLDVRAAERYSGEKETVDPVAGHIPGAINLPATANLHPDGRFLPPAQIARLYTETGGGEGAVLYCGSGITAAHSLVALESAGLTAAVYPGSWSDWISDPSRPVATGTDP
ncbi:MAG TPA: sulfurtransferase [Propionibacteriaceae bacterium]|jgi:thiosulfate/3-mercaptopyruvate sulfurtransferase|nr:sulfurtransferase [Propionibacteriaceae bacterium]